MHSINNKSKIKKTNNNSLHLDKDELLLQNTEILNSLILENSQRKDKSFISVKELEILCEFEKNLIKLLEMCPPDLVKGLILDCELDLIPNCNGKSQCEEAEKKYIE